MHAVTNVDLYLAIDTEPYIPFRAWLIRNCTFIRFMLMHKSCHATHYHTRLINNKMFTSLYISATLGAYTANDNASAVNGVWPSETIYSYMGGSHFT